MPFPLRSAPPCFELDEALFDQHDEIIEPSLDRIKAAIHGIEPSMEYF